MYQPRLFYQKDIGPPGFRYEPEFITHEEEKWLIEEFERAHLRQYRYKGYESKRRIKSFDKTTGYPAFMIPILGRVARYAEVPTGTIEHALISEYSPGTAIGWHRDQGPFEKIMGISLGAAVQFRLRRFKPRALGTEKFKRREKWERITVTAEPRSLYIMAGPARRDWQHSIPPVSGWRYSLTIRTIEKVIKF